MTTNLDIVKRGMRKLQVLASASEATADEAADGMRVLRGLFETLIGNGSFGQLRDVIAEDDYEAGEWERIRADVGVTVTLPTTIDQSTYSATGVYSNDYGRVVADTPRPPFHLAPVVRITSAGVATYSFYNAYKGAWVTINGLDLQDTFPLPSHMEDGFAAMLADAMADDYGQQVHPSTQRLAAWTRVALTHQNDSVRRPVVANYF